MGVNVTGFLFIQGLDYTGFIVYGNDMNEDKQTMKLHVIHFGLFIILAALDLFLVEVFTVSMTATDCLLSSFLFSLSTKKNIDECLQLFTFRI